ncbi:3D-(3,5/4)-trihydroxycyclohexane-1,2-dione acylhydrolase (decyclizing) [Facilibium subflavum]|uniref:3D-(3,5/4)-trihydroxycyclohexane-1,2-dione acylhydrolase (decyclizing) n=1 Tax=Facilibium subflavum TaxID=2219058 RepID=UPI000E64C377|nr:3D-(3,5/4)-trihydroxycyclohexane-1,2-dione acylhydrolase (decyclizing) [Facilibium subflavum]
MQTIRLTTAQALLRFLSNQYIVLDGQEYPFVQGMFTIFGHGNVTGLGEALEYDNYGIKSYRGNNEQGMAHVATAYAKQRNRLGIMACTSSIGPGALNMVTAAGVATSNRIPLLLLPGDTFADRQPDPVLQQIEQPYDCTITANDAFKPVSKYWDRITRPEMLMNACINAMRVLTDPAETGAVVLCLPQDVQSESYDYPTCFFEKRLWYIDRQAAPDRAIQKASELLKSAKNPLIIAGGGVHYSLAAKTLEGFATKHKIAVAETQAGKSALCWDMPFNLGGIGTTGTMSANRLAKKADVILVVGSRLQDFTTASKWLYKEAKVIQINVNTMDAHKMDALVLKGDAKATLKALSVCLGDYQTNHDYQQSVAFEKSQWDKEVNHLYHTPSIDGKLSQLEVLGVLNETVTENDTIICAAGSLPGDLHRLWKSKKPKDYHVEYAFSCMGYEVAAGLGVALAKEAEGVQGHAFVIVGDGSYLMLHSELVTALQERKKFTIVLVDNSGFHCINNLQVGNGSQGFCTELRFRDKNGEYQGKTLPIDFAKYAESLGAKALKANTVADLKTALIKAQDYDSVTLIETKVSPKTMSHGYESWWRVGVAEVSKSKAVTEAFQKMHEEVKKARQY